MKSKMFLLNILALFHFLIHSANPQSRPVRDVLAHVERTYVPTFQNLAKQLKQSENNVRYWRDSRTGRVDH